MIEEAYPAAAYSGEAKIAYEEAVALLLAATTVEGANEEYERAVATIAALPYLKMVDGASVRLNGAHKGLRFCAELGNTLEGSADSTYYMMIVPKSYLTRFGITGNYYTELYAALSAITAKPYIATMKAEPFQYSAEEVAASGGALKEGCWYIRGSLTSVKYDNINLDFFAVAYRVDGNGEYHYAAFTEGENERSLSGVAAKALLDEGRYSEQQTAVLQGYVAMGEAKAAGKTEEEYKAGLEEN